MLSTSPAEPIASITSEGMVSVRGKAKPKRKGMITPFFHKPCVWYKARIYELRDEKYTDADGDTKIEMVWRPIRTEFFSGHFFIVDPTGSVRVIPNRDSKLVIENQIHMETDRGLSRDLRLIDYVSRNKVWLPRRHTRADKHLKFEEEYIPVGDDVLVKGYAVKGSYQRSYSEIPFTIKKMGRRMVISDIDFGKVSRRAKKIMFGSFVTSACFFILALSFLISYALT
jgi:hypothetical protein